MIKEIARYRTGALLTFTLFACGGTIDTTVTEGDGLPEGVAPDQVVEAQPNLIDTVNWNGEQLSFYDVSTPEDEVPSIIVSQLGKFGGVEISSAFQKQVRYEVTPAELWHAATGDDQVPDELMRQHLWQAETDGRPTELQTFDASLTEKSPAKFSVFFQLGFSETGTTTTQPLCWDQAAIKNVDLGFLAGHATARTCTSNGTAVFLDHDAQSGPCDHILDKDTTVRAGAHNGSPTGLQSRICWGFKGASSWDCFATVALPKTDGYYVNSFIKNGLAHRMAASITLPTPVFECNNRQCELGTATLKLAPHEATSTACGTF